MDGPPTFKRVMIRTTRIAGTVPSASVVARGFVSLAVESVVLAMAAPRPGWLSQQYANERFQGPVQASTEFRIPGATRIDARIDFVDDYLPVHFLNDARYNEGMRREVTLPLSIR